MNKEQLRKSNGQHVRLQPHARRAGVTLTDHWLLADVDDRAAHLEHVAGKFKVLVGVDSVKSYTSDPNSDTPDRKCGWLELLVQIDVSVDGSTDVTPLRLDSRGVPAVGPLETSSGQLVAKRYRVLPRSQRAAVAYVLMVGQATERQVLEALRPIGYGDLPDSMLVGMAHWTQLVIRAEQVPAHELAVQGYVGGYSVNPSFRLALEELIGRDPDLDLLRTNLQ